MDRFPYDHDAKSSPDAEAHSNLGRKRAAERMIKIFEEIKAERAEQDKQWGGAEHDDAHGFVDWQTFRDHQESQITHESFGVSPFIPTVWRAQVRKRLVKIAALCVAQIESLDRGEENIVKINSSGLYKRSDV